MGGLGHTDHNRLPTIVKQAFKHPSATAHHAVHAPSGGQSKRAGRPHLLTYLNDPAAKPAPTAPARRALNHDRPADARPRAVSGCPRSGRAHRPLKPRACRGNGGPGLAGGAATGRERRGTSVAAVDQTDDRGSRHESARSRCCGLHGRDGNARGPPIGRGHPRQGVGTNDLRRVGEHGTASISSVSPVWCRGANARPDSAEARPGRSAGVRSLAHRGRRRPVPDLLTTPPDAEPTPAPLARPLRAFRSYTR